MVVVRMIHSRFSRTMPAANAMVKRGKRTKTIFYSITLAPKSAKQIVSISISALDGNTHHPARRVWPGIRATFLNKTL